MRALLSSRERLTRSSTIESFCAFFEYHGALGMRLGDERVWTPADVMTFVPLAFGLLPVEAVERSRLDLRIKPAISAHLRSLGVQGSERLVNVLKSISDQYFMTASANRRRKYGISDVRAMPDLYSQLREKQNHRCAVCGASFLLGTSETLDHVIPWRLVGDVPDGSNYQILCDECNSGKRELLTCLQSPQAGNWIYGKGSSVEFEYESRFLALALAGGCCVEGCGHGPRDAQLMVRRLSLSGLAVLDNAEVVCEAHGSV